MALYKYLDLEPAETLEYTLVYGLWQAVNHQRDLYSASLAAVPAPSSPCSATPAVRYKGEVLSLLHSLVHSTTVHLHTDPSHVPAEYRAWFEAHADGRAIERQLRQAVEAGIPTYLALLRDPDRATRRLAAHLLKAFPEWADTIQVEAQGADGRVARAR